MKKIRMVWLFAVLMLLSACGGPSKAKIEEVQSVYAQLVNSHNEVIEAYADLEDDSFSKELDEMAQMLRNIGKQDAQNMTDEELDAVIIELQKNITRYNEIKESIEVLKAETDVEELQAIPVTIRNNTGVRLFRIYLYAVSDSDKGENLVEDIEYLDAYQTRNIHNLYMPDGEKMWHLEAYDEDGNTIEDAEVDFTEYGEEGVTINLEYSFSEMAGWIEME